MGRYYTRYGSRNRSWKHLVLGAAAFSCLILMYIVIIRNIGYPKNIKSTPVVKGTKATTKMSGSSSTKAWQKSSQSKSLHPLSNTLSSSKTNEMTNSRNTVHHLVEEKSLAAHKVNSAPAVEEKSSGADGEKSHQSGSERNRHAWKKDKHKKHTDKKKKKTKLQRHISSEEYKVMFKKAVLHRLPNGVKPDSERAKLVYDELEAIETRLRKFYEEVNPERIPTIPNIMKKYIFPGDHRSMSKLSERLQEVYGKPAIRKYFVQDTTSHSEEEYGQDQLKALQSIDLKLKLRLFFKHHDKFRMKDVDKIVGSGNHTITMHHLCNDILLKTYSIVGIKKFFGLETDWNEYDSEAHKKIEETIASGIYKDEVPTEDQWMDTLKDSEKKLGKEYGQGNYMVDWDSTKKSLHEMYLYGKGNIGRPDDENDEVDKRIHRHDYVHRHFDEAAQKGHLQQVEARKQHQIEISEECNFWRNVSFSPCHPHHPCQHVDEHTPIFYSKCFNRLGLKYCKKYGFEHGDPGCAMMFGAATHKADQYLKEALARKEIALHEEAIKNTALANQNKGPSEEERDAISKMKILREPGETEFLVKRITSRLKRFYNRVGKFSHLAANKAQNTTKLRRIARLYIDSEDLLFDRLRKKYGLGAKS